MSNIGSNVGNSIEIDIGSSIASNLGISIGSTIVPTKVDGGTA